MTRCTMCGAYCYRAIVCPQCGGKMKMPDDRLKREEQFWNGHRPKGRYPNGKPKGAE